MEKLVTAVGAMSGTSLDGVDVAQITTDGQKIVSFGASAYRPFSAADHDIGAFRQWPSNIIKSLSTHNDAVPKCGFFEMLQVRTQAPRQFALACDCVIE